MVQIKICYILEVVSQSNNSGVLTDTMVLADAKLLRWATSGYSAEFTTRNPPL